MANRRQIIIIDYLTVEAIMAPTNKVKTVEASRGKNNGDPPENLVCTVGRRSVVRDIWKGNSPNPVGKHF